jgi:predicted transcriptional regulator of viral defense system
MASTKASTRRNERSELWELARGQHGVVTRTQLLALGLQPGAIAHRLRSGRLHPIQRGVYAVGRPELSRHGRWLAAVSSCGRAAILSHRSAAALYGLADPPAAPIEVTVPPDTIRTRPGVLAYRRIVAPAERATSSTLSRCDRHLIVTRAAVA